MKQNNLVCKQFYIDIIISIYFKVFKLNLLNKSILNNVIDLSTIYQYIRTFNGQSPGIFAKVVDAWFEETIFAFSQFFRDITHFSKNSKQTNFPCRVFKARSPRLKKLLKLS